MLMRNERLAALDARFDENATATLTLRRDGEVVAEARLDTDEGRRAIEAFLDRYAADELRGPAKVLHVDGFSFSDVPAKVVSLINLELVRDLGTRLGVAVNPLRFRGNIHVEGLPAWAELDLVGKCVTIGDVVFEGIDRIVRCAATNVNPVTAARDLAIPRSPPGTLRPRRLRRLSPRRRRRGASGGRGREHFQPPRRTADAPGREGWRRAFPSSVPVVPYPSIATDQIKSGRQA